jgi:peptide/nickel transport system permease protein
MIVVLIFLLILVVLAAWIVSTAGWRFALQRLGSALLILLLVTFITSVLLRFVGVEESQRETLRELGLSENAQPCVSALGTGATVDEVNRCVDERGLDEDPVTQYVGWLSDVVRGDLGPAFYRSGDAEPLTGTIAQRMPRTAWLFLYSQMIALAIAMPLGIWSAYQAGRPPRSIPRAAWPVGVAVMLALAFTLGWTLAAVILLSILLPSAVYHGMRGGRGGDTAVNLFAFVLLSVPAFVLGESLRFVFSIQRGWYPLRGYAPWSDGVGAHLQSVWLPALVLGLAGAPVYLRLLRADMLQNLQQDFVAVAKAKGMSNTHILLRHVLRPSTVTLLTVAGLNIAQLVNGAIVVEFIYDFDGMGSYLIEAVARREFFAVQTLVALVAIVFVLANTIVDMLYTVVDPRVRAQAPT